MDPSKRPRITVRAALAVVASLAVLLASIRQIERTDHLWQVKWLKSQENQWRQQHAEAVKMGDQARASLYATLGERVSKNLQWHKQQLSGFPRTLSLASVLLLIAYIWGMTHYFVLRAERSGSLILFRRFSTHKAFLIWLRLVFLVPTLLMVLAVLVDVANLSNNARVWAGHVVLALFLLQMLHALSGPIILRERRWPALGIAVLSIPTSIVLAVFCWMSVTMTWL